MHAAPPVRMEHAPDAFWRGFVIACAGAAAANLAAWVAMGLQVAGSTPALGALLAAGVAAVLAWRVLRRREAGAGALVWDGAAWSWAGAHGETAPGEVRVMIDLGAWVLLRFAPGTARQPVIWLVVSRRQAGALWPAWRAALFSPRPGAAAVDPA